MTQHINRSEAKWSNNKLHLQLIEGLLHKLRIVYCGNTDLDPDVFGPLILASGGDNKEGSDGGEGRGEGGAFIQESKRPLIPALRERGLIKQMEEEAAMMGLGGWFNGEDQTGLLEN